MIGPLSLKIVAPAQTGGAIGADQTVSLTAEASSDAAADGTAKATFVAPESWIRTSDADSSTVFAATSANEDIHLSVSLMAAVNDESQVLRESAPIGAAGFQITPVETSGSLAVKVLSYDLSAGTKTTQEISACTDEALPNCLVLTVEHTTQLPAGTIPQSVLDLLLSAEITA